MGVERETEPSSIGIDIALLRAVRSFAWNRRLLPVIQERYNKAEDIVRSRLLVRGEENIQVGPYTVSLTPEQDVELTWNGEDEWEQLRLPDPDCLTGDPLQVRGDEKV